MLVDRKEHPAPSLINRSPEKPHRRGARGARVFSMTLLARALLQSSLAGTVCLAAAPAWAQNTGQARHDFNIPAGNLDQALSRFGRQSAAQISVNADITAGLQTAGLNGSFTAQEGLRRLLAGTGLEILIQPDGGYTLRKAPASAPGIASLQPVLVTGVGDPASLPVPYSGGQVARGGRVGMLGNKDFLDTPFNITAFTAETIQNQQARNLGDVVKNDPSVRTTWPDGSYISQFTIRGFPTQTQDMAVNGLYGIVPPQMTGSLEMIERVEILKGPTALLNGMAPSGGVGGNINLVTKRATDAPITQLTTSYYSSAQFGAHIDLGRRFGEDNRWGVRFNGAYRDGKTGVDGQSQAAGSAALGVDFRGDGVRLSADVGYHHMKTDSPTRVVYTDTANFQIPKAPDSKLNIGQPWYFAKSNDTFGMVQGEVDINPSLTAYASAGARRNDFLGLYNFIYLQNPQGDFRANQYYQPTFSDTRTGVAGLRGKLETGPVRHEINLSVTALNTKSGVLAPVIATYNSNLYNPAYVAEPSLDAYRSSAPKTSESNLNSLALADTLSFSEDRVQLTLGVRQQKVQVQNFNAVTGLLASPGYNKDQLSPAVGLVMRPWSNATVYANYIEGLSQGPTVPVDATTTNSGGMLAPVQSKQYEAGVKYDFGRIAATVGAFQIEQPIGYKDPATQTFGLNGEQRNQGIEVNTFGELARGVRLLGGVTFMRGIMTKNQNPALNGNKAVGVPSTQFNLGGEWDLPFLVGATLNARVIYTASQYYNVANSQSIPAWTRIDLGARYRTRISGKPVTLRAGVENAFDKNYWAAASSSFGLARGAPRTFLLSATMDF